MQQTFKAKKSNDVVNLILIKKSHKCIFKVMTLDNVNEHLNLITEISTYLKNEDIKWVEIEIDFIPVIPANTVSYNNKYNNNFICHIEDFEKFYLTNISKLIKLQNIYCSYSSKMKQNSDAWIKVSSYKTERKEKYDSIMYELKTLVGDWNELL